MTDSLQLTQTIRRTMDVVMHRSWRDQRQFFKKNGLSIPQFSILMQLYYQKHCGITDLRQRMDITGAAASQLVDKLFQSGLVERVEDPIDRRAKQITLSEKGRELIETGITARHRWAEIFAQSLDAEQREKVNEVMELLSATTGLPQERELVETR